MSNIARPDILLASSSPRRSELLRQAHIPFRVVAPEVDEVVHPGEHAADSAVRTAVEKARWVAARLGPHDDGCIVIAADTVVTLDDHILGKPTDQDDARRMLHLLSGRSHQVITGCCLCRPGREVAASFSVCTEVFMRDLDDAEIAGYIGTGEPMDKAGAYAIQGGAGAMVRAIRGSYSNVVGLPLAEVVDTLTGQFGFPLFQ